MKGCIFFMVNYTLTHNATYVRSYSTIDEVNEYINDTLAKNARLQPQQIVNVVMDDKKRQLLVYRYYTCYCEFFMIEKEEW